ncbi:MAG: toll/interleukin-1 receptor domain-containing protein [Nitrospira sp. CG24A]|nr:MAG: toll/interleukin-1 receptor domain-containing protein [Nitrospira sp. CG24A]
MFIAAAVKITPEVEKHLLELQDSGAFGDMKVDFIRQLLALHAANKGPTAVDIAHQSNLSVRTVRELNHELQGQPDLSRKRLASVFISYGGPDDAFARKLYHALKDKGVEVFFFPESATPGDKLHRTMSQAVYDYDRVLLICSRSSLVRPGVLNELEQVLSREAREGGAELLMPVLLDDFALAEWVPERADLARQVCDRVAADFRNASIDSEFVKQLDRVLVALNCEA